MTPRSEERDAGETSRRTPVFDLQFRTDVEYWLRTNPKIAGRLQRIIEEVLQTPSEGIGKPELLRGDWQGCWSRRLTQEHRVLYRVTATTVEFISARFHY